MSVGTQADAVSRGPGLFLVEATPAKGVGVREVLRDVEAELAKIASQGVSQDELNLIRRQAKASQVYKQDSLFSKAMEVGRLVTAGRPLADATDWLQLLDRHHARGCATRGQDHLSGRPVHAHRTAAAAAGHRQPSGLCSPRVAALRRDPCRFVCPSR